ncbi:MAG: glycosyltransferase family 39 protein [bacterium]
MTDKARERLVLLVVLLVSAFYVAWHLRRGWLPPDDGALAQSAERVMQGELPHRDFEDVYTGALAFFHAGAFRLFGMTLWSLRLAVFAVFVAWVPAVFAIASRFVRPVSAGAITLLAVVWSLPNYVAAMPSWYNLFLATFGVAALFRYIDDGRARWLMLAGLLGGLSFLVKVVGLFYIAGVLLFLVFHAQARWLARDASAPAARPRNVYALFVSAGLLIFVAALAALVRRQLYAPEVAHFVVPGVLISALLARNEWMRSATNGRERFETLAKMVLPFLVGAALPIILFLIPYARSGALGAFAHGVFVLPTKRFSIASFRMLPLWTLLGALPLALLVARAQWRSQPARAWEAPVLALVLFTLLVGTGSTPELYRSVWYSVRGLVPLLTVVGIIVLSKPRAADVVRPLLREQTMLLLCVTVMCSMIQLPYSAPLYFCYVAPLVLLTVVALWCYMQPMPRAIPVMVLVFYAGFAVLRINRTTMGRMGTLYLPYPPTERMTTARGAIDIPMFQRDGYDRVISLLQKHSRGEYAWAGPDAPEMYFLAGLRNPTRSLYDVFDDADGHTERVLQAIDTHGVNVVLVNRVPRGEFPRGISADLDAGLAKRFPMSDSVGALLVRWRE